MYIFNRILHTDFEVVSVYIKLDIPTEFIIKSLTDLSNFKNLMENLKMKINKSQLARELNVDRRTIDKYMNGFIPKGTKNRTSKIDAYYEVIVDLLSDDSKQTFYYMRVLWQYLTDNHGLQCSQSTFRAYINRKPEFKKYFEEGKRTVSSHSGKVRYEPLKLYSVCNCFYIFLFVLLSLRRSLLSSSSHRSIISPYSLLYSMPRFV